MSRVVRETTDPYPNLSTAALLAAVVAAGHVVIGRGRYVSFADAGLL